MRSRLFAHQLFRGQRLGPAKEVTLAKTSVCAGGNRSPVSCCCALHGPIRTHNSISTASIHTFSRSVHSEDSSFTDLGGNTSLFFYYLWWFPELELVFHILSEWKISFNCTMCRLFNCVEKRVAWRSERKSCYGFISSGIVVRKTEGMRYSRRYTPENATITKDYEKLIRSYIGGLRHIPPVAPIYKS